MDIKQNCQINAQIINREIWSILEMLLNLNNNMTKVHKREFYDTEKMNKSYDVLKFTTWRLTVRRFHKSSNPVVKFSRI